MYQEKSPLLLRKNCVKSRKITNLFPLASRENSPFDREGSLRGILFRLQIEGEISHIQT